MEIKAPIQTSVPGSITFVGGASCAVTDATLVTGLMPNDFVEAKCTGNPLTLTKIHVEGQNDH